MGVVSIPSASSPSKALRIFPAENRGTMPVKSDMTVILRNVRLPSLTVNNLTSSHRILRCRRCGRALSPSSGPRDQKIECPRNQAQGAILRPCPLLCCSPYQLADYLGSRARCLHNVRKVIPPPVLNADTILYDVCSQITRGKRCHRRAVGDDRDDELTREGCLRMYPDTLLVDDEEEAQKKIQQDLQAKQETLTASPTGRRRRKPGAASSREATAGRRRGTGTCLGSSSSRRY